MTKCVIVATVVHGGGRVADGGIPAHVSLRSNRRTVIPTRCRFDKKRVHLYEQWRLRVFITIVYF